MARIYPFKALLYDQDKVKNISAVLTQPYDKISTAMQERYYSLSPYNLVRIIKGKTFEDDTPENNVYSRAREVYEKWLSQRIFIGLDKAAFFAYFQEYALPSMPDERRIRKGFIGLGKIEDYSARIIFPHERTLAGPRADRLDLLSATRTHFESIFMLYSDPQRSIDSILEDAAQSPPTVSVREEYDALHSIWAITDEKLIFSIQQEMADKQLIIADGHHRYETALAYRDKCRSRNQPVMPKDIPDYEKVMMAFFNTQTTGLTILPTHRLISNLKRFNIDEFVSQAKEFFQIQQYPFGNDSEKISQLNKFRARLFSDVSRPPKIGVYVAGARAYYLFTLREEIALEKYLSDISERQRSLDVVLLHRLLLRRCLGITDEAITTEKNIEYLRGFDQGINKIDRKEGQICFFLNATSVDQVRDIALAGETLPQKSTDFYPKLLSGLTLYKLQD